MLSQSVPQEKPKQSRFTAVPHKRERLNKLNAREDSESIREALAISASVYLSQFEAEVPA